MDEGLYHIHCGTSEYTYGIFVLNPFMFLLTNMGSLRNHEMWLSLACLVFLLLCLFSFFSSFVWLPPSVSLWIFWVHSIMGATR